MPSEPSRLTFSRIEERDFPSLITAVTEILREGNSHKANVFSEKFWKWQYKDLPGKNSFIYGVNQDGKILGYYHIPVYEMTVNGNNKKVAMIQDVAVHSSLRGKGVFRKLAEFANEDLKNHPIDFAYTFPNTKSVHTFLKYNSYSQICVLDTYIRPLNFFIRREKLDCEIRIHENFSGELGKLFSEYSSKKNIILQRSKDYLNWRFCQRPSSKYFIFSTAKNNVLTSACVLKHDTFFNIHALIIMDFAFREGSEKDLFYLLSRINKKLIGENFYFIIAIGQNDFFPLLRRIGFMKVPFSLNPRTLNLLFRNFKINNTDLFLNPNNWHVTLTDWDVF